MEKHDSSPSNYSMNQLPHIEVIEENLKNKRYLRYSIDGKYSVTITRVIEIEGVKYPVFGFLTYRWTYPGSNIIGDYKDGYHWNYFERNNRRMWEAHNSGGSTSKGREPISVERATIPWEIPHEITLGELHAAWFFAKQFDTICNKELGKYSTRGEGNKRGVGYEWTNNLSVLKMAEIRIKVFNQLRNSQSYRPTRKLSKFEPRHEDQKLSRDAMFEFLDLNNPLTSAQSIQPTGAGKTIDTADALQNDIYRDFLLFGKLQIRIFFAPYIYLTQQNKQKFLDVFRGRGVMDIVNIEVHSGSDGSSFILSPSLAVEYENRKDTELRTKIIAAANDETVKGIVFHCCYPSWTRLRNLLLELGHGSAKAAADESHYLASVYDNTRNKIIQEDNEFTFTKKLFLTATPKVLTEDSILSGEQKNNFMNNIELYGPIIFQRTVGDGIDKGYLSPLRTHNFNFTGIERIHPGLIRGKKLAKIKGYEHLSDPTADNWGMNPRVFMNATVLAEIMSGSVEDHKDRKAIISAHTRNAAANVQCRILKQLQEQGHIPKDVEIIEVTGASHPTPKERGELMETINESDKRYIICVGPWAFTGVDCPRIDHVHINFDPKNVLLLVQLIGRGLRLHKDKKYCLISFVLNMDFSNGVTLSHIKNQLLSTLGMIYSNMLISQDVRVRPRILSKVGRTHTSDRNQYKIPDVVNTPVTSFFESYNNGTLDEFLKSNEFGHMGNAWKSYIVQQYVNTFLSKNQTFVLKGNADSLNNHLDEINKDIENVYSQVSLSLVYQTFLSSIRNSKNHIQHFLSVKRNKESLDSLYAWVKPMIAENTLYTDDVYAKLVSDGWFTEIPNEEKQKITKSLRILSKEYKFVNGDANLKRLYLTKSLFNENKKLIFLKEKVVPTINGLNKERIGNNDYYTVKDLHKDYYTIFKEETSLEPLAYQLFLDFYKTI
jgi:hypothetical protein